MPRKYRLDFFDTSYEAIFRAVREKGEMTLNFDNASHMQSERFTMYRYKNAVIDDHPDREFAEWMKLVRFNWKKLGSTIRVYHSAGKLDAIVEEAILVRDMKNRGEYKDVFNMTDEEMEAEEERMRAEWIEKERNK